jgi:hypothetical protein
VRVCVYVCVCVCVYVCVCVCVCVCSYVCFCFLIFGLVPFLTLPGLAPARGALPILKRGRDAPGAGVIQATRGVCSMRAGSVCSSQERGMHSMGGGSACSRGGGSATSRSYKELG